MDGLSPTTAPGGSNNFSSTSNTSTSMSSNSMNRKPPAFRNLQPRAAARMDFNDNLDDSDEEADGILSADYLAQRKTTQDLVDFFKSAPPPPPSTPLPQQNVSSLGGGLEDEKKKRPLLQWLRPKKSGSNLNGSSSIMSGGGGSTIVGTASGRNSMLVQGPTGAASNISTVSGVTMGKGKNGEDITTSTLPNGRKYIMIAVDYKEGEGGEGRDPSQRSAGSGGNSDALSISNGSFMTTTRLPNGGTVSRRQSRVPDDGIVESLNLGAAAKRMSILSNTLGSDLGLGSGGEKRRSILQTGAGDSASTDGSKFVLGGGSFLLENFALDTDFMGQGVSSATGVNGGSGGGVTGGAMLSELQRSVSNKSGGGGGESSISRTDSKRSGNGNKVKFSILDGGAAAAEGTMDETMVAEALAQRLASHKAQQQAKSTKTTTSTATTTHDGNDPPVQQYLQDFPEIVLPKPVSRKKVRHVQIQTQHCVMRTMHTQTEPYDSLVHDLDIKDWSSAPPSISGSTEVGSTTASTVTPSSSSPTASTKKEASTGVVTSARPNSKVASLVASLTQPTAATTATTTTLATRSAATSPITTSPPTPFPNPIDSIQAKSLFTASTSTSTSTETSTDISSSASLPTDPISLQQELSLLRDQNASLLQKVSTLQRDLAAETRARNRTAVAMQDTRDKFEMLSAMAYKKLKEMIFQRHVLEMEVRELRAQVDLSSEVSVVREGEILFRQEQQQQLMLQQQQQQYLYQTA
ncbi:hypothetical protein EC991_004215 [Linnemannia zychae]|nr:hypothetical protein EC991_004215 [Linnemannia zychae]